MLKVIENFKWAYDGVHPVEHRKGDELADDDQCAEVALAEKWVKRSGRKKPAGAVDDGAPAADEDSDGG